MPAYHVVQFDDTLSSHMVLQQAPARASVHGILNATSTPSLIWRLTSSVSQLPAVKVTVASTGAGRTQQYSVPATVSTSADGAVRWHALLRPMRGGPDEWSIHAALSAAEHANHTGATLWHVVWGDVWFCAGQSNMQRALRSSLSRMEALGKVRASRAIGSVRFASGQPEDAPRERPWQSARASLEASNATYPVVSEPSLFKLCAVCWYYAEALIEEFERAGRVPPQLGLVCVASMGTTIEEWSPGRSKCQHTLNDNDGKLFDRYIVPFTRMSIRGWLWYQGEYNNINGGLSGSSLGGYGYGCQLPEMVSRWRARWSALPNTTAPDAPFGVVTVAHDGGWHGARDFGGFRWAQTANYGVLPNEAMPNTFLAQAYDMTDPWMMGEDTCTSCCGDAATDAAKRKVCEQRTVRFGGRGACAAHCEVARIPATLVWIHPRNKRPVGQRLARAAFGVAYGSTAQAASGPTISSCRVDGETMRVAFNASLLHGESVRLQPYRRGATASLMEVLTRRSSFCMQPLQHCSNDSHITNGRCSKEQREWFCPRAFGPSYDARAVHRLDDYTPVQGSMLAFMPPNEEWEDAWIRVNISLASTSAHEIEIDLSPLRGAPVFAVRYAWGVKTARSKEPICCSDPEGLLGVSKPCREGLCPIMASGGLPANPFLARVVDGRCECIAPQRCS